MIKGEDRWTSHGSEGSNALVISSPISNVSGTNFSKRERTVRELDDR